MADSLILKKVKDVRKHVGNEMQIVNPRRGGNLHQIKRWWQKGISTVYEGCTLFDVTTDGGSVKLAIATGKSESPQIRIDHNGSGVFTFSSISELERAALFTSDFQLIEHYIFPAIAGGSIVTVTPPGAAARPVSADPATFGGSTTLSGTPSVGEVLTATASPFSGGEGTISTDMVFQVSDNGTSGWTTLANNAGVASGGSATYTIQASDAGKYIRASYQVTDDDGTISSNSSATSVIIADLATRIANATYTYTVTVVNNVYALNGVDQQAIAASVGESIAFDFSGVAGAHPLGLFTDSTKTTPVTVGVETGGAGNATLLFTPPITGSFSYQCINHANMGGDITVS